MKARTVTKGPAAQWEDFAVMRLRSKEWRAAWQGLAATSGDWDCTALDPQSGEVWQYMCSVWRRGRWWHEFRHRWHPVARRRLVLLVLATESWAPPKGRRCG